MGHIINPISFRLSWNVFWNSNWILNNNFNYIFIFKKDYILFRILDWFFKKFELSYSGPKTTVDVVTKKKANNRKKLNIIFSHYKIYRINGLVFLNFYYYHGLEVEEFIKMFNFDEEKKHQQFLNFSLEKNRNEDDIFQKKTKKILKYANVLNNKTVRPYIVKSYLDTQLEEILQNFSKNQMQGSINELLRYQLFDNTQLSLSTSNNRGVSSGKKKNAVNWTYFFPWLVNKQSNYYNTDVDKVFYKYVLNFYKNIFPFIISFFWGQIVCSTFYSYLKQLNVSNSYRINFYDIQTTSGITANIIALYIRGRLIQRYSLNWILRPVLKDLNQRIDKKIILGYKIVCSGRFTRKQIATYKWMKIGSVASNTINNQLQYSEVRARSKYGLGGIKVWINSGLSLFNQSLFISYPMYLPFKYTIDWKNKSFHVYLNYWFYSYLRIYFMQQKFFVRYKVCFILKIKILLDYWVKHLNKYFYSERYDIRFENNNKLVVLLNTSKKPYFFIPKI